jgi:hypothetical protein
MLLFPTLEELIVQVKDLIKDFSNCDKDLKAILAMIVGIINLLKNNKIKYILEVTY